MPGDRPEVFIWFEEWQEGISISVCPVIFNIRTEYANDSSMEWIFSVLPHGFGKISNDEVSVVKGLKNGDSVVIAGTDRLKDGMTIRLNPEKN